MIALDASVLIALLETGDQHHQRAREFLSAAVDQPWIINVLTLAEVMVAPARFGRLPLAKAALDSLALRVDAISADQAEALALLRAETGLKMPDVCVLLTALAAGASVATFDDRLASAARSRGVSLSF
ncbi:type II toxin-antitoxin system VapC family toxin [Paenarthrobacter sp. Z7-10]|uniref:type II toxin-antitoxin system VapC family toxin n=1 Tax=Paenarthrobacter sp. Z7-10 TaxID=2787635 RepID=UPI0022A99CBC|nr:PIN domain-containing protein [Paenarthrobacter sp. Z7-10]MCZ2404630.1 type II toxin-antitoxin system VapC family toxin [Paenarthrobacter sp. Z7-10]